MRCLLCVAAVQTYRRIVRVDLKFPEKPVVSEGAKDFIRKVCVVSITMRRNTCGLLSRCCLDVRRGGGNVSQQRLGDTRLIVAAAAAGPACVAQRSCW